MWCGLFLQGRIEKGVDVKFTAEDSAYKFA